MGELLRVLFNHRQLIDLFCQKIPDGSERILFVVFQYFFHSVFTLFALPETAKYNAGHYAITGAILPTKSGFIAVLALLYLPAKSAEHPGRKAGIPAALQMTTTIKR